MRVRTLWQALHGSIVRPDVVAALDATVGELEQGLIEIRAEVQRMQEERQRAQDG